MTTNKIAAENSGRSTHRRCKYPMTLGFGSVERAGRLPFLENNRVLSLDNGCVEYRGQREESIVQVVQQDDTADLFTGHGRVLEDKGLMIVVFQVVQNVAYRCFGQLLVLPGA